MAGFGIFMMFLYVGTIGLGLAVITSIALVLLAKRRLSRHVTPSAQRRVFLWTSGLTPFIVLAWIVTVFILYSVVNESVFHRDNGMSTDPHTPLPNGYIIGSVDYHEGYILTPGHQMSGFPHNDLDCIAQVLNLQVTKNYILGDQLVWPTVKISYFILDLQTHNQLHFATLA